MHSHKLPAAQAYAEHKSCLIDGTGSLHTHQYTSQLVAVVALHVEPLSCCNKRAAWVCRHIESRHFQPAYDEITVPFEKRLTDS